MEEYLMLMAMDELSCDDMADFLLLEEVKFREMVTVRSCKYPRLDLGSVSEEDCLSLFRFRKEDLGYLQDALRLPNEVRIEGRYTVSGLEARCTYLRRLAYPNRFKDLEHLFGLSSPFLNCVCKHVMNHIHDKFHELLINLESLPWLTEERLKTFSGAVFRKGAPLQNCWGFIDGTARAICRPTNNQQDYFSGHKRHHCLKYRSILCPDGIIVSLQGPYPGRRHDAGILRETNLYEQLQKVAVHTDKRYVLYGDPAYPISNYILCPYSRRNPTPQQVDFNKAMSSVRQAVEWGFGKVVNEFAFLDFKKN